MKDNMTVNMTLVSNSIVNSKQTAQFQNNIHSGIASIVHSGNNTLYNDDQVHALEGIKIDSLELENSDETDERKENGFSFTMAKKQHFMRIEEEGPGLDQMEAETRVRRSLLDQGAEAIVKAKSYVNNSFDDGGQPPLDARLIAEAIEMNGEDGQEETKQEDYSDHHNFQNKIEQVSNKQLNLRKISSTEKRGSERKREADYSKGRVEEVLESRKTNAVKRRSVRVRPKQPQEESK